MDTGLNGGTDRSDRPPSAPHAMVETVRVWILTLIVPWRVFPNRIRRGEQLRAILFTILVAGAWVAVRVAVDFGSFPVLGNAPELSVLIWALLLAVVVAPIGVHVAAAIATLVLVAVATDRAGVSETVQTVAFAMAPAPAIAVGVAEVQVVAALYGSVLLVYGLWAVHEITLERAVLAGLLPVYLLFVVGFGADAGFVELLRRWYII